MTLPGAPAAATAGRRAGWAEFLVVAALLLWAAMTGFAIPAWAQDDDAFTATVKVDAAGDSAAKAREAARLDGQRRALAALADKMSGGSGAAKLPKLDDNTITNLVASFEVANEKMSSVRYLADMTFHFRPGETQKVLRAAGINPNAAPPGAAAGSPPASGSPPQPGAPTAEPPTGKPALVLPVYVAGGRSYLWDDPNPWRAAWTDRPAGSGKAALSVPLGDLGDVGAIDAERARAAEPDALNAVAKRNGADEVLVMIAAARGPADKPTGLDVTVRRYRQGKLIDTHALPVDAGSSDGGTDLFAKAVSAVLAAIDSGWKKEPAGPAAQQGSLTAAVPISGLDDWVRLRDRLTTLGTIRKVELMSLSRQEAVIEIQYSGTVDQLKTSLADLNLDLVRSDATWRLARSGADTGPK